MNPAPNTPTPATTGHTKLPEYLVLPNLPRDIWYGHYDKPESLQLVAFVEQRHAYINQCFDAQYMADALNEKAAGTCASLRQSHARLLEDVKALAAYKQFVEYHADEAICSGARFEEAEVRKAAIASAQLTKETL